MQQWEYRIFASHLDPADLVVIMNESGKEGWELVTVVAITDYQPLDLIEADVDPEKADEVVQLEAFRYVFKRPVSWVAVVHARCPVEKKRGDKKGLIAGAWAFGLGRRRLSPIGSVLVTTLVVFLTLAPFDPGNTPTMTTPAMLVDKPESRLAGIPWTFKSCGSAGNLSEIAYASQRRRGADITIRDDSNRQCSDSVFLAFRTDVLRVKVESVPAQRPAGEPCWAPSARRGYLWFVWLAVLAILFLCLAPDLMIQLDETLLLGPSRVVEDAAEGSIPVRRQTFLWRGRVVSLVQHAARFAKVFRKAGHPRTPFKWCPGELWSTVVTWSIGRLPASD
jgi:hypothetical protein